MNVYHRLNEARAKFHALRLEKTGHNKFAGYKYFELGDFLIPALSVFQECGLCAVISFDADLARMTITAMDEPQTMGMFPSITITSPMGSAQLKGCHEVQNIGAVETYQRRYLWVAALEIVEHDAVDASAGPEAPGQKRQSGSPAALSADAARDYIASQGGQNRLDELDALALDMIEAFVGNRGMDVLKIARSITDNEEKVYVNHQLRAESKLRAFLKANKDTQ